MRLGVALLLSWAIMPAIALADGFSILDYAPPGAQVDRGGREEASDALIKAISAANKLTARGEPACVYLPAGTYRVSKNPPQFARARCIRGDGPTQSIIQLDDEFAGDLFTWSEAWGPTTPGPTAVGLRIEGSRSPKKQQNAFVFYDRNDEVFLDQIEVTHLQGRALYSGASQHVPQAYMRESRMRSLRFFNDGAPGVPVVEFSSEGRQNEHGRPDATNEIRLTQVDIYGARGPSMVIRNNGDGVVRSLVADQLRIEGIENGTTAADLLVIGDPVMKGGVAGITFTSLELIDPYRGFAAMRITAPSGAAAPYLITVQGMIGGGLAHGQGLRIDAGRSSSFHFSTVHTEDTNVVVGRGVSQILLDGNGAEACWTYLIDPTSIQGIFSPMLAQGPPMGDGSPPHAGQWRCPARNQP